MCVELRFHWAWIAQPWGLDGVVVRILQQRVRLMSNMLHDPQCLEWKYAIFGIRTRLMQGVYNIYRI